MLRRVGMTIGAIRGVLLLLSSQGPAAVGYLGPAGTYTEEAAVRFFGEGGRRSGAGGGRSR